MKSAADVANPPVHDAEIRRSHGHVSKSGGSSRSNGCRSGTRLRQKRRDHRRRERRDEILTALLYRQPRLRGIMKKSHPGLP